ncbi:UNVERIFIED_CONTAM: betA [Trichonephila clavipes]
MQQSVDYIVVGGGSGGCALAGRLSEDAGVSVALLEAGGNGDTWIVNTPAAVVLMVPMKVNNWAFETVPQPGLNGRRGYQPRGKVLGGSSAINAMAYIRGHRSEYDEWAALGNTGWAWDDVLPRRPLPGDPARRRALQRLQGLPAAVHRQACQPARGDRRADPARAVRGQARRRRRVPPGRRGQATDGAPRGHPQRRRLPVAAAAAAVGHRQRAGAAEAGHSGGASPAGRGPEPQGSPGLHLRLQGQGRKPDRPVAARRDQDGEGHRAVPPRAARHDQLQLRRGRRLPEDEAGAGDPQYPAALRDRHGR